MRYQLQALLLAAAEKVATIHFGHRCTTVEEHSDHVQLQFNSGETAACDVAIGADGAHSDSRDSLPVSVNRKAAGDAYLRGISECESDNVEVREIWGVDGRRFGIAPLPQGRTHFYCSAPLGRWHQVRTERLDAWIKSWCPFRSYGL